jgi:hypothetical protein
MGRVLTESPATTRDRYAGVWKAGLAEEARHDGGVGCDDRERLGHATVLGVSLNTITVRIA